jgi:hypothetical protein
MTVDLEGESKNGGAKWLLARQATRDQVAVKRMSP